MRCALFEGSAFRSRDHCAIWRRPLISISYLAALQATLRKLVGSASESGKARGPTSLQAGPRYTFPQALTRLQRIHNSSNSARLTFWFLLHPQVILNQHHGSSNSNVASRHLPRRSCTSRDQAMGELVVQVQRPLWQAGRVCRAESGACQHHWRGMSIREACKWPAANVT
jgi:hypothetical protein